MLRLPLNVWIIAITFSLAMSGMSLLVFIGGIIGTELAPVSQLATLPIAALIVGNTVMTIPAALLAQRFGRKRSGYAGFTLSLMAAGVSFMALELQNYLMFNIGALLIGGGTAFYHQFRFAAIESLADASDTGPALATIMLFSIAGALLGPELGSFGRELLTGFADYSGTYLLFGITIVAAMVVFSAFHDPKIKASEAKDAPRPLLTVLSQPGLIVAILASAVGYALMSFLMTSTPISMHVIDGHSLTDAKRVIQSHLVAMFLPSLFSGLFIKRFGVKFILIAGCVLYLLVIVIALSGQHVIHYWWALVLLGVGWNFLFLGGTTLLPRFYRHEERFRVQALNDFSVFFLQALASLSAAWVLYQFGWQMQLWLCIAPTLIVLALCAFVIRR